MEQPGLSPRHKLHMAMKEQMDGAGEHPGARRADVLPARPLLVLPPSRRAVAARPQLCQLGASGSTKHVGGLWDTHLSACP